MLIEPEQLSVCQARTTFGCVAPPPSIFHYLKENQSSTQRQLFVPIWLEDRNKVRKQMFQQQIFCPVHWPLEGMNVQKGAEMAEHEMSIIIDQRYTNKDMDFILNTLEKALK